MEDTEKPWPLMVTSLIDDAEVKRVGVEGDLLRAHLDTLYVSAKKKLQEEGRMGDIRRLTLVCHNKDEHVVKIVKD